MENHHAGEIFVLAPLLFPWPRSAPPTFFILESPLGLEFCFGGAKPTPQWRRDCVAKLQLAF